MDEAMTIVSAISIVLQQKFANIFTKFYCFGFVEIYFTFAQTKGKQKTIIIIIIRK